MSDKDRLPLVAVTMGDPAGIGPEVVLKALSKRELYESCIPIILGDAGLLAKVRRELCGGYSLNQINGIESAKAGQLNILSLSSINLDDFQFGVSNVDLGLISTFYIIKAAELAASGKVDAIVTGPINREIYNQAGYEFTGHTDLLRDYTKTEETTVMLIGEKLRITRITSHIPLRKVPEKITPESVGSAIRLTHQALTRDMAIENPTIAVCALNPHGGENALFGNCEESIIAPAIKAATQAGMNVCGPLEVDRLFSSQIEKYQGVVTMYHDQGLIPYRILESVYGVNSTLGLPFVRTSPDHGTAYKLAGKGYASEESMTRAIDLAARMVENRWQAEKDADKK